MKNKIEGQTFIHAWNEDGDFCYDLSNERNIKMEKKEFYSMIGIKESDVKRFTFKEVKIKGLRCIRKGKNEADWVR